jgi:iron complex outermembrane receptor protein
MHRLPAAFKRDTRGGSREGTMGGVRRDFRKWGKRVGLWGSGFGVLLLPALAVAQTAGGAGDQAVGLSAESSASPLPETNLPGLDVLGASPLLGSAVDRDKMPDESQVLTPHDLSFDNVPNLLGALGNQTEGVSIQDESGNSFAPNIFYHGFQASPVAGNPQDIAVYVNGMRFNQPFGDVVNWDLLPSVAIDRVEFQGTNPVFGLNALGGAMAVEMKNGFTFQGLDATVLGGVYGRTQAYGEYGATFGNTSIYAAVDGLYSGGWREDESSHLNKIYADLGWRSDRAELHITVNAADNILNEPATVPVQWLDVDRSAVFTAPNYLNNRYAAVNANGTYQVSDSTSVQTVVYYQNFLQRVINGNVPDASVCGTYLCESPGVFLTTYGYQPIPNFLSNGLYSQLNDQTTNTNGYGISLQITNDSRIFGHKNHLIVGVSYDGSQSTFTGDTLIGGLDPYADETFVGPGIVIDQANGSIMPVRLDNTTNYYGVYFLDMFDITEALTLTLAGRFNAAETDLTGLDPGNGVLSGTHYYDHFNPQAGLAYKITPHLTAYADFAESNAIPTPEELSCSNPASPCTLSNFFAGDPNLKQIVARTYEAGLRGGFSPYGKAQFTWNLSFYRTETLDDIQFVYSPIQGAAYYQNIGSTLHQGFDLGGDLKDGALEIFANVSFIDATYQNALVVSSPNNPGADANGNIEIRPGDKIPGIPPWIAKVGFTYNITPAWQVGATGSYFGAQYLYGDEANLLPPVGAYFLTNVNTSYQLTKNIKLFGLVDNAFNVRYATYGTLSPTNLIPFPLAPGASNPRALAPGNPIEGYVGMTVTF